jgi:hypothetical protein
MATTDADVLDDSRIDMKLDLLEREFEALAREDERLLSGIEASPVRHKPRVSNEINHAELMSDLISKISEPRNAPSLSTRLPVHSIRRFIEACGESNPQVSPKLLTSDLAQRKEPGKETPEPTISRAQPRRITGHAGRIVPEAFLTSVSSDEDVYNEESRDIDVLARHQIELERESRRSSDEYAKELLRTLRSLERQMLQEVRISDSSRRDMELELDRMREVVSHLELDRQRLADRAALSESSSASYKSQIRALEDHVEECKRDNEQLRSELRLLKQQIRQQERPIVSHPKEPMGVPFAVHENLEPKSPKAIDPQRMSPELVRAQITRSRPTGPSIPPYAVHDGFEPRSPTAVDPQRMTVGDLVAAARKRTVQTMIPSEEKVQTPPTPTTPKPRLNVNIEQEEKELLTLNLERQELESWLARFPSNSAGRTLAERKEKYLKEKRLKEVELVISEKRLVIKQARFNKAFPMG